MTYAALCELVQARGWCICLTSMTCGPHMKPDGPGAYLWKLMIFESRELRIVGQPPLLAVRLDEPEVRLDDAAEALTHALVAAGAI